MTDITNIIIYAIGLIAAVIAAVPWLRSKVNAQNLATLTTLAKTFVLAAEQLKKAGLLPSTFLDKLDYAIQHTKDELAKAKITYDEEIIRAAIEAEVLALKKQTIPPQQ